MTSNQHLNYLGLVAAARSGNLRALELIIHSIVNQPDEKTGIPILHLYAKKKSYMLRDWDEDDIVSQMRKIIWHATMGTGDPSRFWNPDKGLSLSVVCWQWLRNDVARQWNFENRAKRNIQTVPIEIADYHPDDRSSHKIEQVLTKIDVRRRIERNWSKLTDVQRFIIERFLLGYNLSETMNEINRKGNFGDFYPERVRLELRKMKKKLSKKQDKC